MKCSRCDSERILEISGKCVDTFEMTFRNETRGGYVPSKLFFGRGGYGDTILISFCLECGMIQNAQFPIADQVIDDAMQLLEEV